MPIGVIFSSGNDKITESPNDTSRESAKILPTNMPNSPDLRSPISPLIKCLLIELTLSSYNGEIPCNKTP